MIDESLSVLFPLQPVLHYSSAFDDEVAELPEDAAGQQSDFPEGFLESVLEEPPEAMVDAAPEPQCAEKSPPSQAEPSRPPASVEHGPYYYFYQGRKSIPALLHDHFRVPNAMEMLGKLSWLWIFDSSMT